MKKPNHAPEIIEIKGRKFHVLPESPSDKDTAWTLMEEVNGQLVDPTIDPRIVPGSLIELNQRLKYVPIDARNHPDFDINRATVPIWKATDAGPGVYEPVPSGSCAIVLDRYVKNDVTKLKILINDAVYYCYGIHADLAG